jgi:hypothetical protein
MFSLVAPSPQRFYFGCDELGKKASELAEVIESLIGRDKLVFYRSRYSEVRFTDFNKSFELHLYEITDKTQIDQLMPCDNDCTSLFYLTDVESFLKRTKSDSDEMESLLSGLEIFTDFFDNEY